MKTYDAAVIGGGPSGVAAAMTLGRSGARTVLAEMMSLGGQILRQHTVKDYPGFPRGLAGWELADLLAAGFDGLGVEQMAREVTGLKKGPEGFVLEAGDTAFAARAVVLAAGVKPRALGVPGEACLTGRGVSSCALCDGAFFRDQPVAVVGGDDLALHEALYLAETVSELTLICRDAAFAAASNLQEAVRKAPNVRVLTGHSVVEVLGEAMVEGVLVRDEAQGTTLSLPLEGVFVFAGVEPRNALFPPDMQVDAKGFALTDAEMRTNLSGLFAAGDIRSKSCRMIMPALGDGVTAAKAVLSFLEV